MTTYLSIIITAIFVNNIVLSQFLGICPFIGVSRRLSSAVGMGAAAAFVMTLSTAVTWLLQYYLLDPLEIGFMQTIVFILVIASLVQMLEMVIKKIAPVLYQALGVFLPLITTNCAVLGVAILVIRGGMDLGQSIVYALSTAVGFTLALALFAGIRQQLELTEGVPRAMRGVPVALVCAGLLALAFMGFSGISI